MLVEPKRCRENAVLCEELTQKADTPEHAKILFNLAKQLLKLADELERERHSHDFRAYCRH
jgi:hypothetical protein